MSPRINSEPKSRSAIVRDRRIFIAAFLLCAAFISAREGARWCNNRINHAFYSGNWNEADRLQYLWKSATPAAVETAVLKACVSHDSERVNRIMNKTLMQQTLMATILRGQVGYFDSEISAYLTQDELTNFENDYLDPAIMQILLSHDANPNTTVTPIENDPTRTVLGVLLARRARLTDPVQIAKSIKIEKLLRGKNAKLSLNDSVRFGDTTELKHYLDAGANPNAIDWAGRSLVYLAANNGQPESIRMLVEHGADLNTVTGSVFGSNRETPLMAAESSGFFKTAELLVSLGAQTYGSSAAASNYSPAPLVGCSFYSNVKHIKYLLDHGADIHAATPNGTTPLISACMLTAINLRGSLPLVQDEPSVREQKQLPIIELLIKNGADVNARDQHGFTALEEACWSATLTRYLLIHGANPNIADSFGTTPLMVAVRLNRAYVCRLLIEHGAKVNTTDRLGTTALGQALRDRGNSAALRLCIDTLRSLGARLTLQEAVISDELVDFRKAISNGDRADSKLKDGTPVLSVAIRNHSKQMAMELLDKGAPLDAVDARGWSALMTAVSDGRTDLIKILLQRGARTDIKSVRGATAKEIAERHRNPEIAALLN